IVTDLEPVTNTNYSYVCFFKIRDYTFVACGVTGYLAIDDFKKPYLGMDLLSRIIDEDDHYIKRVSNTYFTGNVIEGNTHFSVNVAINSVKKYNNIDRELQAAKPSRIIEHKLGFKKKTKKKDDQFAAKHTIKLNQDININELDILIHNLALQLD